MQAWTRERPTISGHYWVLEHWDGTPHAPYVVEYDAQRQRFDFGKETWSYQEFRDPCFAGPIEPPPMSYDAMNRALKLHAREAAISATLQGRAEDDEAAKQADVRTAVETALQSGATIPHERFWDEVYKRTGAAP